jgi:hypothetical protein
MEEMQVIIENEGLNGIANYEPLKAWATEQVAVYKSAVVLEEAQKDAKADCARLRKIAKNASDLRVKLKKEHEKKIAKTVDQLTEITKIFNDAAAAIDEQLKAFEAQRKSDKQVQIVLLWESMIGDLADILPLERVQGANWLNKTVDMKTVKLEMSEAISGAREAIATIRGLGSKYETEMINAYLRRLDLNDALRTKAELEQIEAFRAQKRNELDAPVQEPKNPLIFEDMENAPKEFPKAASGFAYVVKPISEKQEKALLDFLKGNGYEFRAEWR